MFIMKRNLVPKKWNFLRIPGQQGQEEGRFRRQTEGGGGEEAEGHQVRIIIRHPGGSKWASRNIQETELCQPAAFPGQIPSSRYPM